MMQIIYLHSIQRNITSSITFSITKLFFFLENYKRVDVIVKISFNVLKDASTVFSPGNDH